MTTIGILGAGQLGRMLALAGYPLGLRFSVFDQSSEAPAGHLADLTVGRWDDGAALDTFAAGCDLVTYEFENVPVDAAARLEALLDVRPGPKALEVAQDRLHEKTMFRSLGIATAPFAPIDTADDLDRAVGTIGLPGVLKTRRMGYDGKGQRVLRKREDVPTALDALGGRPLIYEGFVPFDRELSVLAARSLTGETAFWPLVENVHRDGILRLSVAPAPGSEGELHETAVGIAARVLESLDYVGVLAIELFEHRGVLLANEMAPRVHNSGHWTIEGATTSQFENHLRAILGWPLGATGAVGAAAMVNLVGEVPDPSHVLDIGGAHLHLYGKAPRPGRKLGHVTLVESDHASLAAAIARLAALLGEPALRK